jgi:hypothetical protein
MTDIMSNKDTLLAMLRKELSFSKNDTNVIIDLEEYNVDIIKDYINLIDRLKFVSHINIVSINNIDNIISIIDKNFSFIMKNKTDVIMAKFKQLTSISSSVSKNNIIVIKTNDECQFDELSKCNFYKVIVTKSIKSLDPSITSVTRFITTENSKDKDSMSVIYTYTYPQPARTNNIKYNLFSLSDTNTFLNKDGVVEYVDIDKLYSKKIESSSYILDKQSYELCLKDIDTDTNEIKLTQRCVFTTKIKDEVDTLIRLNQQLKDRIVDNKISFKIEGDPLLEHLKFINNHSFKKGGKSANLFTEISDKLMRVSEGTEEFASFIVRNCDEQSKYILYDIISYNSKEDTLSFIDLYMNKYMDKYVDFDILKFAEKSSVIITDVMDAVWEKVLSNDINPSVTTLESDKMKSLIEKANNDKISFSFKNAEYTFGCFTKYINYAFTSFTGEPNHIIFDFRKKLFITSNNKVKIVPCSSVIKFPDISSCSGILILLDEQTEKTNEDIKSIIEYVIKNTEDERDFTINIASSSKYNDVFDNKYIYSKSINIVQFANRERYRSFATNTCMRNVNDEKYRFDFDKSMSSNIANTNNNYISNMLLDYLNCSKKQQQL